MTTYLRNPLTIVWSVLVMVTIVSWWVSRDAGSSHQINGVVTVCVLLIAAVKAHLVISYFMEVRHAPAWLRMTTTAWEVALFALLVAVYSATSFS